MTSVVTLTQKLTQLTRQLELARNDDNQDEVERLEDELWEVEDQIEELESHHGADDYR